MVQKGERGEGVEWWIARDTLQSWGMSLRREKNWLKCNLICRNLTAVILEFFYASPFNPFRRLGASFAILPLSAYFPRVSLDLRCLITVNASRVTSITLPAGFLSYAFFFQHAQPFRKAIGWRLAYCGRIRSVLLFYRYSNSFKKFYSS